jgi:hypothetical protein
VEDDGDGDSWSADVAEVAKVSDIVEGDADVDGDVVEVGGGDEDPSLESESSFRSTFPSTCLQ